MKYTIFLLIIGVLIIVSISGIYGQEELSKVDTLYFSVEIPDSWMYETGSDSAMAQLMGFGPVNSIYTTPVELETDSNNSTMLKAIFHQEEGYSMKNAPFSIFENYVLNQWLDKSRWNITTSNKVTEIDTEPTMKIIADGKKDSESENQKLIVYATRHNDTSYIFEAYGDPVSFNKYSPKFEQMIKTVKWIN